MFTHFIFFVNSTSILFPYFNHFVYWMEQSKWCKTRVFIITKWKWSTVYAFENLVVTHSSFCFLVAAKKKTTHLSVKIAKMTRFKHNFFVFAWRSHLLAHHFKIPNHTIEILYCGSSFL